MLFYGNERTILVVDGPNNHGAMRGLDWNMDFARLKDFFAKKCHLIRCCYYTAVMENKHDTLRTMLDFLEHNGWAVYTKPVKSILNTEDDSRTNKGNMDVDIAVDVMTVAHHGNIDHIVLFTGDGDFCALIRALQNMGKRVTVVSTTKIKVTAGDLIRVADNFVELDELKAPCARDPKDRVAAGIGKKTTDNAAAPAQA